LAENPERIVGAERYSHTIDVEVAIVSALPGLQFRNLNHRWRRNSPSEPALRFVVPITWNIAC